MRGKTLKYLSCLFVYNEFAKLRATLKRAMGDYIRTINNVCHRHTFLIFNDIRNIVCCTSR
jgi:hypothetical protein